MGTHKYGTSERRFEIMKYLCRNRNTTMSILASMYCVSVRTIMRDIDELGYMIPITTHKGRYGGGVRVMSGYSWDKLSLSIDDIALLKEIRICIHKHHNLGLSEDKLLQLDNIIALCSKC